MATIIWNYLQTSYTSWAALYNYRLTHTALTPYVITEEYNYTPILVDIVTGNVFWTKISRVETDNAGLIDFEANILGDATVLNSIDDAIVAALVA